MKHNRQNKQTNYNCSSCELCAQVSKIWQSIMELNKYGINREITLFLCHTILTYLLWWFMHQCSVEAGSLRVQGQHQLNKQTQLQYM